MATLTNAVIEINIGGTVIIYGQGSTPVITQELTEETTTTPSNKTVKSALAKKADLSQVIGASVIASPSEKVIGDALAKKANISQVIDSSVTNSPSSYVVGGVLAEKTEKKNFYNISQGTNNFAFASKVAARTAVSATYRAIGQIIAYKLSSGVWVLEQFKGTLIADWAVVSNWSNVGLAEEDIHQIVDDTKNKPISPYAVNQALSDKVTRSEFSQLTTQGVGDIHNSSTDLAMSVLLFNGNAVSIGGVAEGYNYNTTDFMKVTAGAPFTLTNDNTGASVGRSVAFFAQIGNVCLPSSLPTLGAYGTYEGVIPEGCNYVRVTYGGTALNFRVITNRVFVKESALPVSVAESMAVIRDITAVRANLFDKNDPDLIQGKYLDPSTGLPTGANAIYATSGFMDVRDFVGEPIQNNKGDFRFICFYKENKTILIGFSQVGVTYIPVGAFYCRTTMQVSQIDTYSVIAGESLGNKVNVSAMPDEVRTSLINRLVLSRTNVALAANDILNLSLNMGNHRCNISARVSYTTFSSLKFGRGRDTYQGSHIEIDNMNVKYYNDKVLVVTEPHGLTMGDHLDIFLSQTPSLTTFKLSNGSGTYFKNDGVPFTGKKDPFIEASSALIVDHFYFNATEDASKNILWIGDSYAGSIGIGRTNGVLYNLLGINSFMTSNESGGGATQLFALLQTALTYSKPSYIVWGSGMNDDFDSWNTVTNNVKAIASSINAELILCTIPSVPSRDMSRITNAVRSSGYRYIDMALAVSQGTGATWYNGMLYSDGVHPTEKGAMAMAIRSLVDFPELAALNF